MFHAARHGQCGVRSACARKGDKIKMARIDEIITRWVREAGKPDARFLHGKNVFEGNNGRTLYSFGTHFPLAEIMLTSKGKRAYWLLNGDHWAGGSGTTTRHQNMVREEAEKTGLPVLIVPFSALREAGIGRDSIKPV